MLRAASSSAVFLLFVGLAPFAQAQVELKHKVHPGTAGKMETSTYTTQVLTINGTDVKTESDSTVVLAVSTGNKNGDGNYPQKVKFESMRANITTPVGGVTFDSTINLAKADSEMLQFVVDAMKLMVGAEFTHVLNDKVESVGVEGTEEIINKASDRAATMLKSEFKPEKLKKAHQLRIGRIPNKALKPGDSWEQTEEVDFGSGQIMKIERRYEYVGTEQRGEKQLDKINCIDKKVVSFEVEKSDVVPFTVKDTDLSIADSKGTLYFDRELGAEVEFSKSMHIKGKMTLVIMEMDLPTGLDLKIETKEKLKD